MFRSTLALTLVALLSTVVGCSSDDIDHDGEGEATTAAALTEASGNDGIEAITSVDPKAAVEAVLADKATERGCRTRVRDAADPTVVHVYLEQCTGRFGKRVMDGELKLTFSANDDGTLHVDRQSVSLTIDGHTASLTGSSDITIDGETRHIKAESSLTRQRDTGETVTHLGTHEIDADHSTRCRVVNGTGVTTAPDREVHSTLTNFTTCESADEGDYCPSGQIEHQRVGKEKTVTKTFDGSNVAQVVITNRKGTDSHAEALDCTPAP